MDQFLASLSLPSGEVLADTKAKLDAESVTLNLLLTVITDEELGEIGISENVRIAIRNGVNKHQALAAQVMHLLFMCFANPFWAEHMLITLPQILRYAAAAARTDR